MKPKTLDHVAFWVADREPIVDFLTKHVGMHVIDRQDAFTLVGSDARRGKLTLFTAEGPRERGAFKHVALRVSDLDRARARASRVWRPVLGEGVGVRLVEAPTDVEYDLDHVALYSVDPEQTAQDYTELGFNSGGLPPKVIRGSRSAGRTSSSIPATRVTRRSRC